MFYYYFIKHFTFKNRQKKSRKRLKHKLQATGGGNLSCENIEDVQIHIPDLRSSFIMLEMLKCIKNNHNCYAKKRVRSLCQEVCFIQHSL